MLGTFTIRRSPAAFVLVVAALLAALLVGGVSGYVIRGLGAMHNAPAAAASSSAGREAGTSQSLYVQGGRPRVVYDDVARIEATSQSLYVQGGRPQVVYDDVARIEAQLNGR